MFYLIIWDKTDLFWDNSIDKFKKGGKCMITIEGITMGDITFDDQNRTVITNDKINKRLNEAVDFLGTQELKLKIKKLKLDVEGIELDL